MNTGRWTEKHFWSVSAILEEGVLATVTTLPGKPSYLRMIVHLQNKSGKFSKHVTLEKNTCHSSMWNLYCTYHQKDHLQLVFALQIFFYTRAFFLNILFHYGLSQDLEYGSLCYTLGPCCLSLSYKLMLLHRTQSLQTKCLEHTEGTMSGTKIRFSTNDSHRYTWSWYRNSRHNQHTAMRVVMLNKNENLSVSPKVLESIFPEGYNFNTQTCHMGRKSIHMVHSFQICIVELTQRLADASQQGRLTYSTLSAFVNYRP